MCNRFIEDTSNAQLVKSNAYRYHKDRKENSLRTKRSTKLRGVIRHLEAQGHTPTKLAPVIHMACAMEDSDDSDYDGSSDSNDSSSEWRMQMEDKRTPVIHTIKIPPPSETPPSQEKNTTPHIETTQWLDYVKTRRPSHASEVTHHKLRYSAVQTTHPRLQSYQMI